MIAFLTSIIALVFVLGVMILIHEWGHYATAKFFGVRVEVFSIGFGKRLFGFRRGETDYRIAAIPLGGYVKMAGENPMEAHTDDPGEFMNHPRWQRILIAMAGPAVNIVFAIGLLTFVYMFHYDQPTFLEEPAVVNHVQKDSAAARAGVQAGDRIIRIDGKQNPNWQEVLLQGLISPNREIDLTVERSGQVVQTSITPVPIGPEQAGSLGLEPKQDIIVNRVVPGMPAAQSGLQLGDEIQTVNGEPVRSMEWLVQWLDNENQGKAVSLGVLRNGATVNLNVTPKNNRLGFGGGPRTIAKRLPVGEAFQKSIDQNKFYSGAILELVGRLVRGQASIKQMDGPIGIAGAAGEAAREGWIPLAMLMAMISLNLGIFNLLPIPILDGGVILLLLIESLIRRDISLRVKERIYQAAFVFLILFAVVVIYNDIIKSIARAG